MSDETEKLWIVPLVLSFDGLSHSVGPDLPDTITTWTRVGQIDGGLWRVNLEPGRDLTGQETGALRAAGAVPDPEGPAQATARVRLGPGVP